MYRRLIWNGVSRSKTLSVSLTAFIAAAALLVALASTLAISLSGAIDSLMEAAATPHFMQMHTGEIDVGRLSAFAESRGEVRAFQVKEFLNIESDRIRVAGRPLAGSVQDNGVTTQGGTFDYLLGLDGKAIKAADGEIYPPVSYLKDGSFRPGDTVTICGKNFHVAGFLRDSQMNSLLASSKRFLVSDSDYAALRGSGSIEYLIEFRLESEESIGNFETAYAAAGLEMNGPTLTYPLFKTLSAISDGLMIAVILLVSLIVTIIAFLCVRFALLAQVEEEYREIGVLKGIGLRDSDIKRIFLAKYAGLAAAGSIIGAVLAIPCREPLLGNIRLVLGYGERDAWALGVGLLGALLVFSAVVFFVNGVLGQFRKIPAAQALRFGSEQENQRGTPRLSLERSRLGAALFLGLNNVLSRKRLYATMLAVFAFSIFIIFVPRALHRTIASENFTSYMGIGQCDIRIDIQQAEDIAGKAAFAQNALSSDVNVSRYAVLTTKAFSLASADGTIERIKVELGDHSVFPVEYASGSAPKGDREIALSVLNAQALGKGVGDRLRLASDGQELDVVVTGIYSDITNGGKTAKAAFTSDSAPIMWCVANVALTDSARADDVASEYARKLPFAKVSGIRDFVRQTFGPTIAAVEKASYAAAVVAWVIIFMVTLLFVRLLVVKDQRPLAVMKAFGFMDFELRIQYLVGPLVALAAGTACGIALASTVGESLAGVLLSFFGASSFQFAENPLAFDLLYPLILAVPVGVSTLLGTYKIHGINVAETNKE